MNFVNKKNCLLTIMQAQFSFFYNFYQIRFSTRHSTYWDKIRPCLLCNNTCKACFTHSCRSPKNKRANLILLNKPPQKCPRSHYFFLPNKITEGLWSHLLCERYVFLSQGHSCFQVLLFYAKGYRACRQTTL